MSPETVKARVLTIEDESRIRESIIAFLEDYGYETLWAENGEEGIELFRKKNPEIVLTDLRMPKVNGLTVLETIREESPDTAVIIVSGTGMLEDAVNAIHLGAWDYVMKPIPDMNVLELTIQKALDRSRLIRQNREYQNNLEQMVAERTEELEKRTRDLEAEILRRSQTESALRESEERFRLLYDRAPIGYQSLDEFGYFLEVNQSWLDTLGYRREEVIGHRFADFITSESLNTFKEKFPRFKETGEVHGVEFDAAHKDGHIVRIRFDGKIGHDPEGRFQQTHCVLQDVTEQKRIESYIQSVVESMVARTGEECFSAIVKEIIKIFNADGAVLSRIDDNGEPQMLAGYLDGEETTEFTCDSARAPCKYVVENGAQIIQAGAAEVFPNTPRIENLEGFVGRPLFNRHGVIIGVMCAFSKKPLNIPPRVDDLIRVIAYRAASEIERIAGDEERNRLMIAVEQVGDSISILSPERTIEYANPSFEKQWGIDLDHVMGEEYERVFREARCVDWPTEFINALERGDKWTGSVEGRKGADERFVFETDISPVSDDDGALRNLVVISRDMTRQTTLAEQLRQSQKMEALGTLAGGIAHDFNNVLSAVIGFTELSLEDTEPGSVLHKNLDQILLAGERAGELVRQILTFSRQTEQKLRPLKLQPLVKEMLKLIRGSLPSTIEIQKWVEPKCEPVLADPIQIQQALMNLTTNAGHAMSEQGGTLTVTLRREEISHRSAKRLPELAPGTYAKISVSDTGTGINEETVPRIFEPYFTTKAPGEGTGLGLATTHGIVIAHNGSINVETTPGEGTTFHIYLPLIEDAGDLTIPEKVAENRGKPEAANGEHILFVDDEVAIAELMAHKLDRMGYRMTVRNSAPEALEVFLNAPSSFDIIITDYTMPRMSGLEMAEKIRTARSDIPILMCTGFGELSIEERAAEIGISQVIRKPVLGNDLIQAMRKAMNKAKTGAGGP